MKSTFLRIYAVISILKIFQEFGQQCNSSKSTVKGYFTAVQKTGHSETKCEKCYSKSKIYTESTILRIYAVKSILKIFQEFGQHCNSSKDTAKRYFTTVQTTGQCGNTNTGRQHLRGKLSPAHIPRQINWHFSCSRSGGHWAC